ncbi:Chemotaxis signal transduction protein [Cyclonatronum proteinivorum]|uniref:Chemotaxis signal transduction protein n=1 Tax=Cyclonatronum proteinivorum TaxID=1457365 RepID=A0A345UKZ9_9BACT|nr:chemotaxis protein CheW [Cyclonatronum proteinivorum]AXJ01151.1 Chemotaxis signal transduction protein [Cyclonatronum proteinivorum]
MRSDSHSPSHYFVLKADSRRFAVPIRDVAKIIPALYVTRIPDSPPEIEGYFDFHGDLLPLLNLRCRLGLNKRPLQADDVIVIVHLTEDIRLGLLADEAEGLVDAESLTKPGKFGSSDETSAVQKMESETQAQVFGDKDGIILAYRVSQLLTRKLMVWLDGLTDKVQGV